MQHFKIAALKYPPTQGRCAISTFLEVDPLLKNGSQETIYISAQRKSIF